MNFSNLFFESQSMVLVKTESFVELKFPTSNFDKPLLDSMTYDSFSEKSLTLENLTKDCEEFVRLCNSLSEGGLPNETLEHRFMKEFIEADFPDERFDMSLDLSMMLADVSCYQQLEACYKPALLGFLVCKYNRPKLFAAVLLDAMIRDKLKEWQLDVETADVGLCLMDLYLSKKEKIDKAVVDHQKSINLSPSFKLDALEHEEIGSKSLEKQDTGIEKGKLSGIAADVLFSIMKEYTCLFVKHLQCHSKEMREADMKAQSLQSLLLKLRANLLSLQADFEVAVEKLVSSDLPQGERKLAVDDLKKRISNEAKMKKEILMLRENSKQLDRDLNRTVRENERLNKELEGLQRTALEKERLEKEVELLQEKVKSARSLLNE